MRNCVVGAWIAFASCTVPSTGTQTVTGTVSVGNLPATQPVSGSVEVGNFPAVQAVSGAVTTKPAPFGVFTKVLKVSGATTTTAPSFVAAGNVGTHSVMAHVAFDLSVEVPSAGLSPLWAKLIVNAGTEGSAVFSTMLTISGRTCALTCPHQAIGRLEYPVWIPANSAFTVELGVQDDFDSTITGTVSFTGINLD